MGRLARNGTHFKPQLARRIIHGLTSFRRKLLLRLILRVTVPKQTAFHNPTR